MIHREEASEGVGSLPKIMTCKWIEPSVVPEVMFENEMLAI